MVRKTPRSKNEALPLEAKDNVIMRTISVANGIGFNGHGKGDTEMPLTT